MAVALSFGMITSPKGGEEVRAGCTPNAGASPKRSGHCQGSIGKEAPLAPILGWGHSRATQRRRHHGWTSHPRRCDGTSQRDGPAACREAQPWTFREHWSWPQPARLLPKQSVPRPRQQPIAFGIPPLLDVRVAGAAALRQAWSRTHHSLTETTAICPPVDTKTGLCLTGRLDRGQPKSIGDRRSGNDWLGAGQAAGGAG